jgi:hypothetical protein
VHVQNRELRLQALQLRIAFSQVAEGDASAPDPKEINAGSLASLQQLQQLQQQQQEKEGPPKHQQEQEQQQGASKAKLAAAGAELLRAARQVAQLQQENELLMDMSSALRYALNERLLCLCATLVAYGWCRTYNSYMPRH